MNPDTGEIRPFQSEAEAKRAGFTVPLSSRQAGMLKGMSRRERREWLKEQERGKRKQERANRPKFVQSHREPTHSGATS